MVGALAVLVAAMLFSRSALETFDTPYDRYFIGTKTETSTMRPIVTLVRDFRSIQSAVYADNGEPYMLDYYRYYDVALAVPRTMRRSLLIGGGTFSYPRHQLEEYPDSVADVVEIDPTLLDVARSRFSLKDDPRLNIFIEDGRTFLNRASGPYDVVLIDAFKSANSIPYQLTTIESMRYCYDVLGDDGVLTMNIIASTSGAGSRFLWAEYLTLKAVFPQVEMYAVFDPTDTSGVQNMCIMASKSTSVDLAAAVEKTAPDLAKGRIRRAEIPQGLRVITDDFAPVDQYLNGI
jgi:spermidine synthase